MARTILVAEGSSVSELQSYPSPISHFQEGQRGQVVLTGPGLSLAGDAFGAEQLWGQFLVPAGAAVIDVHGEGSINPFSNSQMVVDWVIPSSALQQGCDGCGAFGPAQSYMALGPVLVAGIILAIGAVLAAAGWLVNNIRLLAQEIGGTAISVLTWGAIGLAALIVVNSIGPARKTRSRRGN